MLPLHQSFLNCFRNLTLPSGVIITLLTGLVSPGPSHPTVVNKSQLNLLTGLLNAPLRPIVVSSLLRTVPQMDVKIYP